MIDSPPPAYYDPPEDRSWRCPGNGPPHTEHDAAGDDPGATVSGALVCEGCQAYAAECDVCHTLVWFWDIRNVGGLRVCDACPDPKEVKDGTANA